MKSYIVTEKDFENIINTVIRNAKRIDTFNPSFASIPNASEDAKRFLSDSKYTEVIEDLTDITEAGEVYPAGEFKLIIDKNNKVKGVFIKK